MKRYMVVLLLLIASVSNAQITVKANKDAPWRKLYRSEATKINDLVHTKLDVSFDYSKSWMYGKVWITLKPHFYPTDSLNLDAKAMEIKDVALVANNKTTPLTYDYNGMNLFIKLNKTYGADEKYTIYINYIAKPNEYTGAGSVAITDAKGLYFINPTGEDKSKPTQIWTQGETEGTSVWVPTIDRPNQKSTDEINMTVPDKYVTLSNGLLIGQKKNADGTRTDSWKMDLPHAPYLFFMGVGEYTIIKDSYKGKEVSYYVEKEYAPVARKIFGYTPEMMKFFSEKLGVEYQWQKYAQIVGRDYVSGAMENTTATLHQETANQNARQLVDGNEWEETIAHELFHQWFGDLVTAESWSNLTVNESFADFSETLWDEYKHGKDAGDEHNYNEMQDYLSSSGEKKDLVRFYYKDQEDMFDAVSYNKGGRILNMLRNYVGEDAFFKSLNNYLTTNKFKTGEAQQLRLAFESVTGKDLNWFWNQWYYGSGHPIVKIDYKYDDAAGKGMAIIQQTQSDKIFKLPVAIDVYTGATKQRFSFFISNKTDTFRFAYNQRPDLVNVDGDKIMLWEKTDNKTAANYIAQIKYAPLYVDRIEALNYFAKKNMPELLKGLDDAYAGIRSFTLSTISSDSALLSDENTLAKIEGMVKTEKDPKTKARAIEALANTYDELYKPIFEQYVNDSSYTISGEALSGLNNIDSANAYKLAKKYIKDAKGKLASVASTVIMINGAEEDFDFVIKMYATFPPGQDKFDATFPLFYYLSKLDDIDKIKQGIDQIVSFRNTLSQTDQEYTDYIFKAGFDNISQKDKELEEYIKKVYK